MLDYFVEVMHRDRHVVFIKQIKCAKRRGIAWDLAFDEWLKIWLDSGKFHLRGSNRGKYVMARTGDKGPYALGNVRIATNSENASEGSLGIPKSPEAIRKVQMALIGRRLSFEHKMKISAAKKGIKFSDGHRMKISLSTKGKKRSFETRKRISLANERRFGRPTMNPLFMEHRYGTRSNPQKL